MLSQSTLAQIAQVTEQAIQRIPTHEVIDRVTIIRGYAQLVASHPTRKEYGEQLAKALGELYHVAKRRAHAELAQNLQSLVEAINAERLS